MQAGHGGAAAADVSSNDLTAFGYDNNRGCVKMQTWAAVCTKSLVTAALTLPLVSVGMPHTHIQVPLHTCCLPARMLPNLLACFQMNHSKRTQPQFIQLKSVLL